MTVAEAIKQLTALPDHSKPLMVYIDTPMEEGYLCNINFIDDTLTDRVDLGIEYDTDLITHTLS